MFNRPQMMIDQNFIGRIVLIIGAHCGCSQLKPGMDATIWITIVYLENGLVMLESYSDSTFPSLQVLEHTPICATQSIDDRNKLCACATRSSIGKEPLI